MHIKSYVLARKGILASNPDVQKMTSLQWLWEYHSLIEKDEGEVKKVVEIVKVCKHMLIKLLGLDLMLDGKDKDDDQFVPMSLLVARREIAEVMYEKMTKEEETKTAVNDDAFEKLSAAIANGEDLGDMTPILDDDKDGGWRNRITEADLKRAGVTLTDRKFTGPHISFDKEAAIKKIHEQLVEVRDAREATEKMLKDEKSSGVKFDDA